MANEVRTTILDITAPMPSDRDPSAACLVVIYGDALGQRLALGPRPVVCGREETCDVQLVDERVSRRHAQIRWTGQRFVAEDLGSTNGTFVNGTAIDQVRLQHGDQLQIGRTIYKFLQGNSAEAQYHQVIYELMTSDGLTRAQNKRFFEETMQREISRARRYGRPLALLLFDIDHFKRINDEHGHMAGDEVLRQLGALVAHSIRREDVFGRIGGEEFAVLIPEGTLEGGRPFAERLRETIAETPFRFEELLMRITCSFGLALLTDEEGDSAALAQALVQQADRRLYAAKHGGRNRVVAEG